MDNDNFTQIARRALNILFVSNGQGTSIGIAFGIVSHGFIAFLMPTLKTIGGADFNAIKMWHLIAFWVAVFNVKPYLKRNKPDPKVEEAINLVKTQLELGQINKTQAKMMYYELTRNVVESVTVSSTPPERESPQQE
ncbi:hypothetical protein AB4166_02355 [Vibrio splendidus]